MPAKRARTDIVFDEAILDRMTGKQLSSSLAKIMKNKRSASVVRSAMRSVMKSVIRSVNRSPARPAVSKTSRTKKK